MIDEILELAAALQDPRPGRRSKAIHDLGARGPSASVALDSILELEKDSMSSVRMHVALALPRIAPTDPRVADSLARLVDDPSAYVRQFAKKSALEHLAPEVLERLISTGKAFDMMRARGTWRRYFVLQLAARANSNSIILQSCVIYSLLNRSASVRAVARDAAGAAIRAGSLSLEDLSPVISWYLSDTRVKACEMLYWLMGLRELAAPVSPMIRAILDLEDEHEALIAIAALAYIKVTKTTDPRIHDLAVLPEGGHPMDPLRSSESIVEQLSHMTSEDYARLVADWISDCRDEPDGPEWHIDIFIYNFGKLATLEQFGLFLAETLKTSPTDEVLAYLSDSIVEPMLERFGLQGVERLEASNLSPAQLHVIGRSSWLYYCDEETVRRFEQLCGMHLPSTS